MFGRRGEVWPAGTVWPAGARFGRRSEVWPAERGLAGGARFGRQAFPWVPARRSACGSAGPGNGCRFPDKPRHARRRSGTQCRPVHRHPRARSGDPRLPPNRCVVDGRATPGMTVDAGGAKPRRPGGRGLAGGRGSAGGREVWPVGEVWPAGAVWPAGFRWVPARRSACGSAGPGNGGCRFPDKPRHARRRSGTQRPLAHRHPRARSGDPRLSPGHGAVDGRTTPGHDGMEAGGAKPRRPGGREVWPAERGSAGGREVWPAGFSPGSRRGAPPLAPLGRETGGRFPDKPRHARRRSGTQCLLVHRHPRARSGDPRLSPGRGAVDGRTTPGHDGVDVGGPRLSHCRRAAGAGPAGRRRRRRTCRNR